MATKSENPDSKSTETKEKPERKIVSVAKENGEDAVKKTAAKAASKAKEAKEEVAESAKEAEAAVKTAAKAAKTEATTAVKAVADKAEDAVEDAAEAADEIVEAAKPATKPATKPAAKPAAAAPSTTGKKSSAPWRIAAGVAWLLGVAAMVLAVIMIMEGNERLMYVGIGGAAVFCVVGAFLWKHANRISPCKVKQDGTFKSKLLTFLWNQMGVLATFVIFLPIGLVLLLKSDKLSPNGKKWAAIITAVLVAVVGAVSADYNAPVAEASNRMTETQIEEKVASGEITVPEGYEDMLDKGAFFTKYGYSFHFDENCRTIARSLTIYSGSLADALEANKLDPCDFCALNVAAE